MTKFCGDCTYTDVVQVNMLNISTISSSQHRVEMYLLYLSLATNEWYTIKMWHQTKIWLSVRSSLPMHHICKTYTSMWLTLRHEWYMVTWCMWYGNQWESDTKHKRTKNAMTQDTFWWNYISWMKRILHKLQKWRNNGESSLHIWSDVSKQR